MKAPSLMALVVIAATCAACGSNWSWLATSSLKLDGGGTPATARAEMNFNTTPDGGFYLNHNVITPLTVVSAAGTGLNSIDGSVAAAMRATAPLGRPLAVIFRITNHGQAGSDPAFGDVQIASDYAPPQAANGSLHHYYHPLLPLAIASTAEIESGCAVHLDPGAAAITILFYPPIRSTPTIFWGVYGGQALTLAVGGQKPQLPARIRAAACPAAPIASP